MIVTRGGKEYEPSTDPAIIAPKQKDMSHAAFVLWETMIGLILERQQAVEKWERIQALEEKASENPDHPKVSRIWSRIYALDSEVAHHQRAFLDYEEIARREWDRLEPQSMESDEGLTEMYHIHPIRQLPPLWNHPLGESSKPAPFPMSTTALQLASPALIRVYQGGRR
jgi:hypothetical protein